MRVEAKIVAVSVLSLAAFQVLSGCGYPAADSGLEAAQSVESSAANVDASAESVDSSAQNAEVTVFGSGFKYSGTCRSA
ncbi:MAG: hypothetical protein SOS98_01595 [Varibaculum sp.]|nr:hypothetical protein [Varibaculum sp.]